MFRWRADKKTICSQFNEQSERKRRLACVLDFLTAFWLNSGTSINLIPTFFWTFVLGGMQVVTALVNIKNIWRTYNQNSKFSTHQYIYGGLCWAFARLSDFWTLCSASLLVAINMVPLVNLQSYQNKVSENHKKKHTSSLHWLYLSGDLITERYFKFNLAFRYSKFSDTV